MKPLIQLLRQRGVSDRVIDAFAAVDRASFVPEELRGEAHGDYPLPIGGGQTISQPSLVAYMLDELRLRRDQKVLEVGVGSGYVLALLGQLCETVIGAEADAELAKRACESYLMPTSMCRLAVSLKRLRLIAFS